MTGYVDGRIVCDDQGLLIRHYGSGFTTAATASISTSWSR
jgi:hypothetical protein